MGATERSSTRLWLAAAVAAVLMPASAISAEDAIDPDAANILKQMSAYLGGLQSFSANYEADFDVLSPKGQKLKFISTGSVAVERPGHMRVTRKGTIADVEFILDGERLTLYGLELNAYVQLPASTIDEAIEAVRERIGLPVPGADLIAGKPLDEEVTDIVAGTHVGMTTIGGETVHHLAFQGEQVDWQLWVKDGDKPLPVRYVITTKWMAGAPEYSLQISEWNVAPSLDASAFKFVPPEGAKKLASITVDETGQVIDSRE